MMARMVTEIHIATVKKKTNRAVLLEFDDGREAWIPSSLLRANKKGLVVLPEKVALLKKIPQVFRLANEDSRMKNTKSGKVKVYGTFVTYLDESDIQDFSKIKTLRLVPFELSNGEKVFLKLDNIISVRKARNMDFYQVEYLADKPIPTTGEEYPENLFPLRVSRVRIAPVFAPYLTLIVDFTKKKIEVEEDDVWDELF